MDFFLWFTFFQSSQISGEPVNHGSQITPAPKILSYRQVPPIATNLRLMAPLGAKWRHILVPICAKLQPYVLHISFKQIFVKIRD
jgi:hypothetical protein